MAGKPGIKHPYIQNDAFSHQERVNMEMFKAISLLGRKLERAEGERERLIRRLIQIESAATVDEETGKLYLPVVTGNAPPPQIIERSPPSWQGLSSVLSSILAICAIGIVLFREPAPPAQQLTPRQLAALDALARTHFAELNKSAWKPIGEDVADSDVSDDIDIRKFTLAPEVEETPAEDVSTTRLAESDYTPTVEELAAIEPAAGTPDVVAEEVKETPAPVVVAKVAEKPAPAPEKPEVQELTLQEMAAVPGAKTAPVEEPVRMAAVQKPVPEPANEFAPIPLTPQSSAKEEVEEQPVKPTPVRATLDGVSPDPMLPGKLSELERRAFASEPEAQHDLATLYASGKLVGQDFKRAVFWFSKAASQNVANAHYNLGVMFQQGLGVRKDVNKALGWYEKAAQLGHPEAMYNLGIAYIEGIGTARNITRGVAFFKQAANAGVAQAAYNLGVLYESNFIGPIDLARASEWYQVAANEGHQEARDAIARLKGDMGYAAYDGDSAAINDQGLTLANVEPAAGGDEYEGGYGEGDATPLDEQGRAVAPAFGDMTLKNIQDALIRRGELPAGSSSGYMTPQTEDVIRLWQKKLGWDQNGKPTRELLEKIEEAGL